MFDGEEFMDKRIFICTHSKLPQGDANSNYIYHMALALAENGWSVIAIGRANTKERSEVEVKGIKCINIPLLGKFPPKVEGHILYGKCMLKELKAHGIKSEDYVIIYGGYLSLFSELGRKLSFIQKGHVVTCVVEWPTEDQFKYGKYDLDFQLWRKVFYKWMPNWSKIVVISYNLQKHFNMEGCITFLLPPLIDCKKKVEGNRTFKDKVQLIYAGADARKDAIRNMLLALKELSKEERDKFEFHITSLTIDRAKELLDSEKELIDEYKECLHIHGWMEYEELIHLYYSVDYLLLAREENQFTISNFPSKVPEMMNYGIVPVCSRVGDYTGRFLHNMEDSLIFEGASVRQCADAIRRAIAIPREQQKEMSVKAIKSAETYFDYRVWSKRLTDFLTS